MVEALREKRSAWKCEYRSALGQAHENPPADREESVCSRSVDAPFPKWLSPSTYREMKVTHFCASRTPAFTIATVPTNLRQRSPASCTSSSSFLSNPKQLQHNTHCSHQRDGRLSHSRHSLDSFQNTYPTLLTFLHSLRNPQRISEHQLSR